VSFKDGTYHKYATIRSLHSNKCLRTFRLGPEYDKERLRVRLVENQYDRKATQRYFDFLGPSPREYAWRNPPTERYYKNRDFYTRAPQAVGNLSLFRCVAIVLGLAPLYEDQVQKPLSPECREACRKLDRITDEITLVAQERLDTPQDIQAFIAKTDEEMDELTAVRNKIRNQQRHCTDPAQKAELKQRCTACTTALAQLRRKKQTAYHIIEDNPKLRELLECERDAQLENDPYLSDREKRAIRQRNVQRKDVSLER
jgi:hypothetical protein